MKKRVFLIVLDSFGVGELPDAAEFSDVGSHTLKSCTQSEKLFIPTLKSLGLYNIDGIGCGVLEENPKANFAKMIEKSMGKDTTIGHWEISGIISEKALPTYKDGFPLEIIKQFEQKTGTKIMCNKPYSGTKLLEDYGEEHMQTGNLIVYTSADSVMQIAAHEDIVPIEKLYKYCEIAREILQGEHGVGRVIARPFEGEVGNFKRTTNRHDYSLTPPKETMLTKLQDEGFSSIGIGKIYDIFAGVGVDQRIPTKSNEEGMQKTIEIAKNNDFEGLCFVNLVDFDMLFGHRNDVDGYANALTEFDVKLAELLEVLREEDILIITADHGCDPKTISTDNSREYIPLLVYGKKLKSAVNLGIRQTFSDIGATILNIFDLKAEISGNSFLSDIK